MDHRRHWSSGRVAHVSLKGRVQADRFIEGTPYEVVTTVATIWTTPGGKRDRQLLLGRRFIVLDREGDHVFGFAEACGYAGWVRAVELQPARAAPTHVVKVARSYAILAPELKTSEDGFAISGGSLVHVTGDHGRWVAIHLPGEDRPRYMPKAHLNPADVSGDDPVEVAELLLGTPYLWGGNSAFGIDCSGLVQIACHACGIACPGDGDMQEAELGQPLPDGAPRQRGDLVFWKGHVAWLASPDRLIHANAHDMAVAYEDFDAAVDRIIAQGDGPVTSIRRL
ncbi:C40 family peptidase [Anianabacter salinae]|uniref:C40 family peptidase n=1 Tax=Anianabacter salinae TaxID=2851023 RepID=UPI00225E495B|nr:NlpC/P60 family protein [Anianabacter salinae]MBV0913713.1 C40 family peptidase [Anianabacter salinae]